MGWAGGLYCGILSSRAPEAVREVAWNVQWRMCQRYRHLVAAGKAKVIVTTAIAQEMASFIWATGRAVTAAPPDTPAAEAERKGVPIILMRKVGGGTR